MLNWMRKMSDNERMTYVLVGIIGIACTAIYYAGKWFLDSLF